MAAITLDIGGNTRQLDRDIQKTVNKVYSINLKTKGDQPLGRITGKVNEFNKSLDASNARVIAFGASAGIIFGVERAFTALVSATIEVQKSLQDINVILNVSQAQLQKFGSNLFDIAKNTGQSFQEVAKAATEFSRQGLGIEETLKRTNEALILSRLSGLDAAKSVESLTAAVNSFASQAVTATEVVNKFATVDAAFAVSSADLAEAISRVGSSAAQSGVSINELIALVTSAQQTTARGGAVIGNSFKTIFTRLERGKVRDLLESLGISTTDSSGQLKSTVQLLQDLGKVYDTLGSQQQAYVAEQVGGVFQINILKAALADLGKEYSIYSSALNVAAGSTDQAIRRNEELNKTYAAQINALQENARQLAAAGGERLLGPTIDRLVGGTNTLLEGFSESDGQGVGAVLGKGILDGIGQFIAGPGLALIGGVLLKLFRDLAKFATGSVQQLLGLNTAATQQRDLQQSINSILAKNPQLLELALKGEQGLNSAANSLLASLQKQTVELQKQAQVTQQISKAFIAQAGVRVAGGVPVVPTPKTGKPGKAVGYIPNFASDKQVEKAQAIALGATPSVRPHMSEGTIGGKKFVMNDQEVEFPNVGKNGDSMVLPTYGDGPKIAAAGFIPNFAENKKKKEKIISEKPYGYLVPSITPGGGIGKDGVVPPGVYQGVKFSGTTAYAPSIRRSQKVPTPIETSISKNIYDVAAKYSQQLQPLGRSISTNDAEEGFNTIAGAKGAVQSAIGSAFEVAITKSLDYKAAERESGGNFDVRGGQGLSQVLKLFNVRGIRLADFKVSTSPDNIDSFRKKILNEKAAGGFSDTEIKANAQKQAVDELRNDPQWKSAFRSDGTLRTGYKKPEGFDKALEEKTKEIERERYNPRLLSRRGRAAGYIPNFASPKFLGGIGFKDLPRATGKDLALRRKDINTNPNFKSQAIDAQILREYLSIIKKLGRSEQTEKLYRGVSVPGKDFKKLNKQSIFNLRAGRKDDYRYKDFTMLGTPGDDFEPTGIKDAIFDQVSQDFETDVNWRMMSTSKNKKVAQAFASPDEEQEGYKGAYGQITFPKKRIVDDKVYQLLLKKFPGKEFDIQRVLFRLSRTHGGKGIAFDSQMVRKYVENKGQLKREEDFPIYARGFIPNFAAIQDAISRERAAGIPSNQIYLAQDNALTSANPMGLGVFNKRDEPTKRSRKDAMRRKGFASGYIPNFAETPESSAAGIGAVSAALVSQLGILAFSFQGFNQQYKESLSELTKSNIESAKKNLETTKKAAEKTEKKSFIKEQTVGGVRQQPGGILAAQKEINKNQESINQAVSKNKEVLTAQKSLAKAEKGRIPQKLEAGSRAGGLGLALAAPILAQTLTQAIPQDTKGGRVGATAVGALGNIGAATATGAMFGPIGAAVGLAAGALLEIPNVVGALSTNFPELQAAVQKSSEALTKFSDAGSQLLTSFENLQTALKDPNTSQDMINKASDAYAKALMGLSSEDQKRLQQAAEIGNLEEEYAKILSEKTSELKSRESAAEAGRIAGEAEKTNNLIDMGLGVATAIPGFAPTALALKESGLVEALRPKALEIGSKEDKSNQQAFVDQILQGKTGKDAVGALEKAGGTNFVKELLQIQPGDTKALEDLLNKTIPEGAGKADFVAAQIQMANNGTADFGNVIGSLGTAFTQTTVKAQESVKTSDALIAAQQKEAKAKQEATKATEQIIDSLQRNIRMAQMAADTNRALAKANSEFQRNTAFADTFTRPTETVGTIVGQGAPLAEAFKLREDVAKIGFNQVSKIEEIKFNFVDEINKSITTAFDDAVNETTKKASGEGKAADIQKGNKEILAPLAGQQEKAFAVVQDVLNKSLAGGGDIQTEALLSDISKSLQEANINGEVVGKITAQVRDNATKGNLEITKLRDQSIKEFKTLAKEQTQKILVAKIQQAQKFGGASVGGGIEEFINPKESGQGVFDKVIESTKGFEKFQGKQADFRFDYMPGTDQFKYQYAEAKKARTEMAPERGQKALSLIDQLQDFTGYTPDAEGKGVQAGVAGLTEFFNKQIKELVNVGKTTSDPLVREEINAALKEVDKLGGVENIAKLQVAQRTGALTEKGYKEITGKFQNPVLQSLQEQIKLVGTDTPEGQLLAQQLEELQNVTITSQDPTIQAINTGNVVLKQILTAIKNEAAGTTGTVEPFDIGAYTNEKDPAKRAAMKDSYDQQAAIVGVAPLDLEAYRNEKDPNKQLAMLQEQKSKLLLKKDELDKKLGIVPQQAFPQDNRTIAEIEAETRTKRDQKLGVQPQTGIYTGGYINGMRADEAILDPAGQQAQSDFNEFRSKEAERKAAADAELQRVLAQKEAFDAPARTEFEQFRQSRQIADPRNDYALEEDRVRREMTAREKMIREGSPLSSQVQNQPAAAAQQSFAQQEAAFNNNTSALTTLAGGIESLNSTLSNFEANFANLNNVPGGQQAAGTPQAGAQPGVQTTTNAPVNVVVNAQGSNDIAAAVGAAVQNAIPTIIDKVRVALGQKVAPTSNPKFGGGQRADGGFLL